MIPFILLAPIFWMGYFSNELLFWLPWAGFVRLCFLYQARRRGNFFKDFLVPCWGLFLAVYSVCFFFILSEVPFLYCFIVIVFPAFIPLLFWAHHLLTLKVRSQIVEVAAMFVVFLALEFLVSRISTAGSLGLDFLFQPPAPVLCVLKFFNFKVWSSWVFTACFTASYWARGKRVKTLALFALLAGGMVLLVVFAHVQSKSPVNEIERTVKVALVQHNLPYSLAYRVDHFESVKEKYRELTLKASLGAPDLIVFPLYSFPEDVYREPSFLEGLARTAGCPILVATDIPIKAGDKTLELGFMKLALLYDREGRVMDIYKAVAAIPLTGQYVEKARKYRVIRGPFGKLGVLICFEDSIPRLSREAARDGAGVLVALSNPGLFQTSPVLYHHLFQDQIRAAETGLPLIRVSSNGYSALIDRTGTVVKKTELDTEEILQVEFPVFGSAGVRGEDLKNPLLDEVERRNISE